MHGNAWATLLRHLPAEQHSKLMLMTSSGTEIALQTILRIDPECVAVKGRVSGSQDSGRVFFVPYRTIDYLGFQGAVKEEDFQALFDTLELPAAPVASASVAAAGPPPLDIPMEQVVAPEPQLQPDLEPELATAADAQAASAGRTPSPLKSAVLERFRSRTSSNGLGLTAPGAPRPGDG